MKKKKGCRYGCACAYQHSKQQMLNKAVETKSTIEWKKKVRHLENTVEKMA